MKEKQNNINHPRLSKTISHALRHEPEKYSLVLDSQGWIEVDKLLRALAKTNNEWQNLTASDLEKTIEVSAKKRFEIKGGKIKALYGHSLEKNIEMIEFEPPEVLYHSTNREVLDKVLSEGLKPMQRQYVHLSTSLELTREAAKRRSNNIVDLKIDTKTAYKNGVKFYKVSQDNEIIWLVKEISNQFLSIYE